jgi:hypothetical protein
MRRAIFPLLCLMLAACAPAKQEPAAADTALIASDPVIARALNDPLMSDPDLASRNEANAVIGFTDSSALPVLAATSQQAQLAREAARLELLTGGSIPDLPSAQTGARGKALGPMASAGDLIAALGAPARCVGRLKQDFTYAANLPIVASIMPRGMVLRAGGADSAACRIRIVRYTTAAAPDDVLQYHYTRAKRAGLRASRHAQPEDIIAANGKGIETLVVHVRPAAHGLSGVDLLYRAP